jgi:dihydrofolate reductase
MLGRKTYQVWVDYWPPSTEEPFASFINSMPKYVVSTTLDKVDWDNTTLIKGDLAAQIEKLKNQPGTTIGVQGSPTLVRSLLEQGLLDELTLMVHPVVAGKGKRLFQDSSDVKRLKLADSRITDSGVAVLTYQPLRKLRKRTKVVRRRHMVRARVIQKAIKISAAAASVVEVMEDPGGVEGFDRGGWAFSAAVFPLAAT